MAWIKAAGKILEFGRGGVHVSFFVAEQRLDARKNRLCDINAAGSVIQASVVCICGGKGHADFFHHHVGAHHIIAFDRNMRCKTGSLTQSVKVFTGRKSGCEGDKRLVLYLGQADLPSFGKEDDPDGREARGSRHYKAVGCVSSGPAHQWGWQ